MKLSILKLLLAMALLSDAFSYPLAAAPMSFWADVSISAATVLVGSTELEAFIDSVMIDEMKTNHVPGAVVSVVKDGQLTFEKGYGYSDYENGIPVNPEHTLFRVGSISKLFIWTAVMQLVEQGKLSLDADVNTYLDFKIPATYPQPITMKNLMAHTAGLKVAIRDYLESAPMS